MILLAFSIRSDVGYIERKKSKGEAQIFGLSNWKLQRRHPWVGKKCRWSGCFFWFAGSRNSVSDRCSLRSLIHKCKFEAVVRWVESVGWKRYRFRNYCQSKLLNQRWSPIAVVGRLLGTKDQLHGRPFSHRPGVGGLVSERFSMLHLLCPWLLCHQLHLRSWGVRSRRRKPADAERRFGWFARWDGAG